MTFIENQKKIIIPPKISTTAAGNRQMGRSPSGYIYTPPEQPPERTVSIRVLIPPTAMGIPRSWLYRDEIFQVEITVTGEPAYTGTMELELSQGETHQDLGDPNNEQRRGSIQMYDFGSGAANPFCINNTSIESVTFVAKDKGKKRFKAVINIAQTIKIKVTEIDENGVKNKEMSAETPNIEIKNRLRQYTTKYGNGPVNNYDGHINEWVIYWNDWDIGANGKEPPFYTFLEGSRPDGELVKAVAYKESSMKDDNKPNLMRVTETALNGMTTGTADKDPDASALPEGYDPDTYDGEPLVLRIVAPPMNYGTPTVTTVDDSFKWGVRWLIAKRAIIDDTGGVYSARTITWWGRTGALKHYNGEPGKEVSYPSSVRKLYEEGRNPNGDTPKYLWPIKADGCPRQTENPPEETPEE